MKATSSAQFNPVYWLSMPPELRALDVNATPDEDARRSRAIELAFKGFKVDVPIMVYGWDPFKVQLMRLGFGYTWVPNAIQAPVGAAPGLTGPGIVPYDPANPPGGAIKVSIDLDDYPAFDPPKPAAPAKSSAVYAGPLSWGNMYYETPAGGYAPDGYHYEDERGKFVHHVFITPWGRESQWEWVKQWPA